MKTLIALSLTALLALPAAASAASPEQAYLAARDAYIKTVGHDDTDRGFEQRNVALADLEAQLRKIIGPTTLPGFPAEGKIHLDGLSPEDEGFGLLDGLAYAIPLDDKGIDEKVSVVVTTRTLFETWLRAHKTSLQAAPKSDEFYRQALSTDAGVVVFAPLPVAKPSWAGTERAYAVTAKTEGTVGPIAACERNRQQLKTQADAAQAAYEKSGAKNTALIDKSFKLQERADRAYVQCFATRAKDDGGFAAAVKQAQALIDLLPAK